MTKLRHILETEKETASYKHIFLEIQDALKKTGVVESTQKAIHGRPSWWTFLDAILLPLPDIKFSEENLESNWTLQPLGRFIAKTCNGETMLSIKMVTLLISHHFVAIEPTQNLHRQFQSIKRLIQDIHNIVHKEKKRAHRHMNRDEQKSISNTVGPKTPVFTNSGFCHLCHRTCDSQYYYCINHRRATGGEAEVRRAQRMINAAFKNLNLTLHTETGIKKEEIFHSKCRALIHWSKHRIEHTNYRKGITKLAIKYGLGDKKTDWPFKSKQMILGFISLTNKFPHTSHVFSAFDSTEPSIEILQDKLKSEIFDVVGDPKKEYQKFDAALVKALLLRMSQMSLIKIASSRRKLTLLGLRHE